ncbi:MAG: hypothetical protein C6Y20_16190 [Tagaea sp. CACIAM 22H2]|nr:hypothetical protein [Tagaea sp. CACIAM 22H2]
MKLTCRSTLAACAAAIIRRHAAASGAIGFCTRIALPAAVAFRQIASCVSSGEATTIASISVRASAASRSSVPAGMPRWAANAAALAASRPTTIRTSASGSVASASR